ncbi:hypothetical protein [Colwellia sp. BRX8-7]|jgi:hypothetical protein|nr:hypothetical protein [Colwellia sp. BRX8-7]
MQYHTVDNIYSFHSLTSNHEIKILQTVLLSVEFTQVSILIDL